ncbi:MAG: flavodoxin-dependent (E)-4-hydroxy-3-methylbut-2-enyl-diphosphate synthase [Elusimicrobiales bacterium]|nr:flavodoxin-dependent (E)-4-hydroxy-3-methylbut-2-enyl-diphosphate synthase [Elusimicrobiales bacterium]
MSFPIRRPTRRVRAGGVAIGGGAPISVQAMCNTDTRDLKATIAQANRLEAAGCEIVRVAVPDMEAALNLRKIKNATTMALVADIHFDHRLALEAVRQGADKIRINPGNIGGKAKVREVAKACAANGIPIRIGVNSGSLAALKKIEGKPGWTFTRWTECMVSEALKEVAALEEFGFKNIVVSLKADDAERTVLANRLFASRTNIPLHIGVTEAGSLVPGVVKSSIALGALLRAGIGDTVRVSLTEPPELQVRCAFEILKALGLRAYGPDIISCPTCGRCCVDVHGTVRDLEKLIYSDRRLLKKAEGLKIAVMGCAVNGPGEAREADFGIAGGQGEGVWIEKGKILHKIPQNKWVGAIIARIEKGR